MTGRTMAKLAGAVLALNLAFPAAAMAEQVLRLNIVADPAMIDPMIAPAMAPPAVLAPGGVEGCTMTRSYALASARLGSTPVCCTAQLWHS